MKNTKYRAWDEQFKIMRYDYKIWFHPEQKIEYWLIGNFEPFVWRWENGNWVYFPLMQYTWLKDKNGKEIYEGDIVRIHNFDNKCWVSNRHQEIKINFWESILFIDFIPHCEIIWNIHENPELLTN